MPFTFDLAEERKRQDFAAFAGRYSWPLRKENEDIAFLSNLSLPQWYQRPIAKQKPNEHAQGFKPYPLKCCSYRYFYDNCPCLAQKSIRNFSRKGAFDVVLVELHWSKCWNRFSGYPEIVKQKQTGLGFRVKQ